MIVVRSPRFDRAYKKLSEEVRDHFRRKLRLLVDSRFTHSSLRVKRIQGTADIWEASIDMRHRFTFQKIEGSILLRVIGPHEVLDNPYPVWNHPTRDWPCTGERPHPLTCRPFR